jgi:6-phospho-beta-glucosidase
MKGENMKLSVIGGAGSRSLMLIKSLAHESRLLGIKTLVFMDSDRQRLNVFGPLILECARRLAPGLTVRYTDSAEEAVGAPIF